MFSRTVYILQKTLFKGLNEVVKDEKTTYVLLEDAVAAMERFLAPYRNDNDYLIQTFPDEEVPLVFIDFRDNFVYRATIVELEQVFRVAGEEDYND